MNALVPIHTTNAEVYRASTDAAGLCREIVVASAMEIQKRLLARAEPDLNSGCWLWSGAANPEGYGHIKIQGRTQLAHRVSWMAFGGSLQNDELVLHGCDTPACVNPYHLRPGSHGQNMSDRNVRRRARGGSQPGERHGMARLTIQQVEEIRAAAAAKIAPQHVIGKRYGISQTQVSCIHSGKRWSA